ncbi:hypothetical protein [Microbacterium sp.]|uniref:hypothetical protein n=1 Tax=Microbacterium sp. TaxID=51671 RepID=UPI0026172436|nr:hypothetical protein [Microbacterium sp.]MCV0334199.1 ATP-binding protein [Microbacterium sp.]MCV0374273.1 ATP-binding protein [Microbacterium sp.]MCV0389345.1 ATP-binding protein [Microbacterium sp.]MCV0418879.1 ATP-binding protein [Microbacterium sp.]MCV0421185.1 ATP-binding protein [Microbacterium sp.]
MVGRGGGAATAYGIGYQHLAVLEEVIGLLEQGERDWTLSLESADDDIVDYAFRKEGRFVRVVQAKSSVSGSAGRRVTVAEALRVFERMVQGEPSTTFTFRTNRPVASALLQLGAALDAARQQLLGGTDVMREIQGALEAAGAVLNVESTSEVLGRIARCEVVVDAWQLPDAFEFLAARIRALRHSFGWGTGRESSEILVYSVAMRLLERSATTPGCEIPAEQIERMLYPADHVVAQARGAYDWGVVAGPIPNIEAIPRVEARAFLDEALRGMPTRQPRRAVLTGFSGAGKSTIAASFARDRAASYDHILWIDAHDLSTIRQSVRRILGESEQAEGIGDERTDGAELAASFRDLFAASSDTWLLVFDNAASAREIQPWRPLVGHVDIVATSTNAVAWSGWRAHGVPHLARTDSIALLEMRMGVSAPSADWRRKASQLSADLDDWPLTLDLACAYLSASGRGIEFAPQYVSLLMSKIIDEEVLMPEGYKTHSTLLRAVVVALEGLESRAKSSPGPGSRRHGVASATMETMAYLPGRSAHANLAVTAAVDLLDEELQDDPDAVVDAVAFALAEFSLASRRMDAQSRSLQSTFRVNEVVLHVVRARHSVRRRAEVLRSVIESAYGHVTRAIDERARADAELVAPSATSALRWLLESGYASMYGTLLAGNLAVLWSALNQPEISLEYFELELHVLNTLGQHAPVLRAKIHAAIASNLATLERPTPEILDAVSKCVLMLDQWPVDDAESDRTAVLYQLETVLNLLRRNPREDPSHRTLIDVAYSALERQLSRAGHPAFEDIRAARELLDLAERDGDALVRIEKVIADSTAPDFLRRAALALRVETLVYLGRFEAATRAVEETRSAADGAFGIEEVADVLINAWLAVLTHRFLGDVPFHHDLVGSLYQAFADIELSQRQSQSRLDVCRLATAVHEGDIDDEMLAALEGLSGNRVSGGRGVRSDRPLWTLIEACGRLVALRRRHRNARVVPGQGWALVRLPFQLRALRVFISKEQAQQFRGASKRLEGSWLLEDDAVLLRVDCEPAVLVVFPRLESGWLGIDEAVVKKSPAPATRRLEQILHSPQHAETVRFVLVAPESDEDSPVIVTVSRPVQ